MRSFGSPRALKIQHYCRGPSKQRQHPAFGESGIDAAPSKAVMPFDKGLERRCGDRRCAAGSAMPRTASDAFLRCLGEGPRPQGNSMSDTGSRLNDAEAKTIEGYLQDIQSLLIGLSKGQAPEFGRAELPLARDSVFPGGESDLPLLAKLAREEFRERERRKRFLSDELFGEPAWDLLLDLYANRFEGRQVSMTSACIASGVPPTTALRWIGQLIDSGLLERRDDPADQRRAWVDLTDSAYDLMSLYLAKRAEVRFNHTIQLALAIPAKQVLDAYVLDREA